MNTARSGRVVALVPAAGRGERLGMNMPKAFVDVAGQTMIARAVRGLLASGVVDHVVVVVPSEMLESVADRLPDRVTVAAGGAERTDSVCAGLDQARDADFVLVHDAARALTPPELIRRVVDALRAGRRAVVPVLPVSDTVKEVEDVTVAAEGHPAGDAEGHVCVVHTPDRTRLRAVQTPQGFDASVLHAAYDAAADVATDDAGLVERIGETVTCVDGDPLAFKITTPLDLLLASTLAAQDSDAHERGAAR
ncbi:2-C-methyl-D-erythritol 4-phosphate cytidylyltransferase [Rhodococcus rhodnii]|uniref:2-C-methyl-D-erythritol 4-phosphate cytidylyltransferase n=1 Tax=Rhodococcus rhodnii TaxID=38312 RepID=A0A6P2CKC1_9NOCA|nr:2-C-methyl-D-erythritol 4-phosphate cytidylyltransferase [Rhodococcus rhodnii]